ncbi:hypothetical protein [Phocaeicola coprophilus]|jgi:uncharacterized protein (TIGR02646 family)|uniref:hypothetical protein n=1 Tax=Phocaeicola coprophilus TaxID=387090 RepID=UPI00265B05A2|nr:hypothetical protein [Phocaeicola coprophilus]
MRKILKQLEPREWTKHRLTPGAKYEAVPELRKALLEEQGYLCAYCMRRIPIRDTNSNESTRIDHILSRTKHPELQLNYSNMVVCCPGAITSDFHCDKQKGENDITINLFEDHFFDTLSYSSKDGRIKSSDAESDRQINELLNLNHALLKRNRLETLRGVILMLNRIGWTSSNIRHQIEIWNQKDQQGHYKPYNSIVVWFLKKKMEQN